MTLTTHFCAAMLVLASVVPVVAADHEVQMLNKGEKGAMVFQPALIRVAPGDTVTFFPTDKSA